MDPIDGIGSVEGLEGVFVVPYDLSGSTGIVAQLNHPWMAEARTRVLYTAAEEVKAVGIHEMKPESEAVKALLDEGFNFIACSIDTDFLGTYTCDFTNRVNQLLGEE